MSAKQNNINYENWIFSGNVIEYNQPDAKIIEKLKDKLIVPVPIVVKAENQVVKKEKPLTVEVMPLEKIVEKKQPSDYDYDSNRRLVQSILQEKLTKPDTMGQLYLYAAEEALINPGIKLNRHLDQTPEYDRTKLDQRVKEDYNDAGKNLKNAGFGLKKFLIGIIEAPFKAATGLSYGFIPELDIDGIKNDKNKGSIFYPIQKIIGDAICTPINGALDAVKGTAFAAVNATVQPALDLTVNNIELVREGVIYPITNTALLVADFATNVFPGGDASQRVHSMDINNKDTKKKFPFVNNFYTATHFVEHGGQKTEIQNIGLRPIIETTGSLIANILFFDWLTKNGGHSHHAPTPSGSLEGGQYGGPGAGAGF